METEITTKYRHLVEHVLAMDGDPYLEGHPEWVEIFEEARTGFEIREAAVLTANDLRGGSL